MVRVDEVAIYPELAELRARTEQGDWAGVSGYLRRLHEGRRFEDLSHAANTGSNTEATAAPWVVGAGGADLPVVKIWRRRSR